MNNLWEELKDIPQEHKLPFAVFTCKKEGLSVYESMSLWHGVFDEVSFITEWLRQVDHNE